MQTCIAGWTCTYSNPWYSQCLQSSSGSATATSTSSGTATSSSALPTGTSNAGLALVAKAAGKKYFGSATDNPELTDTAYVALLSNSSEFGQITPVSIKSKLGLYKKLIRHPPMHPGKQHEMGLCQSQLEIAAVLILFWKDATEPSRGTFTFAAGDVVADLAIGNGQLLRGKSLT